MNLPGQLLGQAALMRQAMRAADALAPIAQELLVRAQQHPDDAGALLDLSTALQLMNHPELALEMQNQALALTTLYHLPASRQPSRLRLLVLLAPGDLTTNVPLDCLLENSDVELHLLYLAEGLGLPASLPEHDLLYLAMGSSEPLLPLLEDLIEITRDWPRPVVNLPALIPLTTREATWQTLQGLDGVRIPATVRLSRAPLQQLAIGQLKLTDLLPDGTFPLIIRPIDSHAGKGLEKLETPLELRDFLARHAQTEFHLSRFIDYRSKDGYYRKARIALINGQPYACHLGISTDWMIHYLNAGMAESASKRAEEAAFFASFDTDFAERHGAALVAMHTRMPLDYLVMDCAETADGQLLIFEVDTGAVVHALDSAELFPYKKPQMNKVFAAFYTMLLHKAGLA